MIGGLAVPVVIWVVLLVFYTSLSLFIPEKLRHSDDFSGFKIIAHNALDISKNVREILKKNLESIKAQNDLRKVSDNDESEFKQKCTTYFENYFMKLFQKRTQIVPREMTDQPTRNNGAGTKMLCAV